MLRQLVSYGVRQGLIEEADAIWAYNGLLSVMGLEGGEGPAPAEPPLPLEEMLDILTADAVKRGVCGEDIDSRAPLTNFTTEDVEPSIVQERG